MKKQTCEHCAYVGRVRNGRPGELICANCPVAPGELVRVEPDGTCPNFRRQRCPRHTQIPTPLSALPPPTDKICYIPLTRNQFATVDAADYPELSRYRWKAGGRPGHYYAVRHENGKTIYLHRQLMQPPPGMVTDHINGNSLNDCRSNLRNCTQRENQWNSRARGGASGFKGVSYYADRDRYRAEIWIDGKRVPLGWFDDSVEAARVRDRKALEVHGPYTFLNLPQDLEPRPVPPDPNHPERRAGIAGPYGYLRCAPYAPLSPPGPGLLDLRAGGLNRIIRVAAGALKEDHGIARATGNG
jgi:hypothetical protein